MNRLAFAVLALATPLEAQSLELHFESTQKPVGLWNFDPFQRFYGDVNGDGLTDVVVSRTEYCRLILGNPDGTFAWAGAYLPFLGGWHSLLTDLNGDGLADWVHSWPDGEDVIAVRLGNGTPGTWWGPPQYYGTWPFTNDSTVGDLNSDGFPDVITVTGWDGSGRIMTFLNDGTGRLTYTDFEQTTYALLKLDRGDVNGDGQLDVVAYDYDSFFYFQGEGDGHLRTGLAIDLQPIVDLGHSTSTVKIADIDEDGLDEVLATGFSGWHSFDWQDGHGFQSPVPLSTELTGIRAVLDMNGDGHLDLLGVLGPWEAGQTAITTGDGTLFSGKAYPLPDGSYWADLVDLDGDGLPDLSEFVGENNESLITFNRSQPSPWTELPAGTSGAAGTPRLDAHGVLLADTWTHLGLDHAPPAAPGLLVIGGTIVDLPLLGGVLVPSPDSLVPITTDTNGEVDLEWSWPSEVLAGTSLGFQAWILDPEGPGGWVSSNGILGTAP